MKRPILPCSRSCRCTGPFTTISTSIRLSKGRWVPHYAGGAAWPEARYWGGDGSDFKRKTTWNGEQQIYVDPRYGGRATTPLGLDPFKVKDGVLSIVASRTPPALKPVLFNNEYISGILTTQGSFAQKYGYFEIRAKIPVGIGVWPAFWMLADDGGWPPEIDVLEGRGAAARRPRDDDALADSGDPARCNPAASTSRCRTRRPRSTITACCGSRTASSISSTASRCRTSRCRSASTIRCT